MVGKKDNIKRYLLTVEKNMTTKPVNIGIV